MHSTFSQSVQAVKGNTNPALAARQTALQRRYIRDRAALITYLAGRRHGKTEAVVGRMVENARPHTMQAYVAPTITRAGEILMPILRQLQRDCGLRFTQVGDHITFPSGGAVRLMGMSNVAEIQKLRGEDLLAAYFDECGVPKSAVLKEAVLSCAWEALRKHRGEPGSGASLSGTPGPVPGNPAEAEPDFWWQVTTQNQPDGSPMYGASRHFGLIYDNPIFQVRMPDGRTKAEHSIEEDLKNKLYLSREDSRFRREVLAQWCLPSELRCYGSFGKILRPNASAPTLGRTVIAVDFGWGDHTAIVVIRLVPFEERYPQEDGSVTVLKGERLHVLYATKRQHWKLGDLAAKLLELQTTFNVGTIVGDSGGGASRQVVESFASTWGVPMLPAMKNGLGVKRSRIHTIDDLFAIGHIVVYEDAACLGEELGYLVWNEDRDDHDPRQQDHCADAFGYAIIETYVPVTSSRIASRLEQEREAAEQRKRAALYRRK
jgi:hypothetical protein